ncbi:DUF4136 domain-containing protein [Endozoicomonas numazuensis]|uniref:DUF4136 domain-containing protein n=1 Tax=Endozoicomonas numazuensis TaxID=1137799 RepID=A0A081NE50_9GAMM|nr:DUF4136 domain-containing protein [Endozoicomonas numazuensis]KEQ16723.1 hypothetical protein GZ78_18690 [Endozoicomonas numazuensis]
MYKLKQLLIVIIAVAVTGCSSQRLDWDYNNTPAATQSMKDWKTYAWLNKPGENNKVEGYHIDGLMDMRIRAAITRDLQARGYREVTAGDHPDFLVNYLTTTRTRRELDQITTSMGYGWGAWGMGATTETRVRDYQEGSLIIDVVNPKNHELEWRGRSTSRVVRSATPEDRTEKVNTAVKGILDGFPPGHKN